MWNLLPYVDPRHLKRERKKEGEESTSHTDAEVPPIFQFRERHARLLLFFSSSCFLYSFLSLSLSLVVVVVALGELNSTHYSPYEISGPSDFRRLPRKSFCMSVGTNCVTAFEFGGAARVQGEEPALSRESCYTVCVQIGSSFSTSVYSGWSLPSLGGLPLPASRCVNRGHFGPKEDQHRRFFHYTGNAHRLNIRSTEWSTENPSCRGWSAVVVLRR